MKTRKTVALTFSFFLLSNGFAALPAGAGEIEQMLKNIVEKKVLKKGGTNPAQANTINNINAMESSLTQQITDGAAAGKITAIEETELRAQLSKIAQQKASALADGKYNDPEVISLLGEMNSLGEKIKSYTDNTSVTSAAPAAAAPAAVTPAAPAAPVAAPVSGTPAASTAIYQRIADGLASGKISRDEANNLFKIESRIHDLDTQLRRNTLGDFERQRMMFRELEQLTQSIDSKLGR
ncbi:MAG: hypothetical protein IPM23_12915 [Candidatus Melainabacteria bacterium]|nr:hypothetical protein [Candidatus Melainabacteria bacterium]